MKILITAFEPFGKLAQNSAHLAMELLPDKTDKHTLFKATLPVVYGKSIDRLKELIFELEPDAVVCLGQAAGAINIRVERIAVNLDDTSAPGNEGIVHIDVPIVENDQ